jgi:hypothetical protein
LGEWLADRHASLRLLGSIFGLGGLSSFGILAVDALGRLTPGDWPIVVEILVLTAALFFIPGVILGAISPVVAKLAVRDLNRTGITVGRIYAAGSLGSIVGTFLTTKEFNDRVHAWLDGDGLYVVNIVDGPRGNFLRAYVHTLQQTFAHVYLAPTLESWRQASRSTFVLIASDVPLEQVALSTTDGGDGVALLAQRLLSEEEVVGLLAGGCTVMLTDRYAPVDQMLAPVFREEVP